MSRYRRSYRANGRRSLRPAWLLIAIALVAAAFAVASLRILSHDSSARAVSASAGLGGSGTVDKPVHLGASTSLGGRKHSSALQPRPKAKAAPMPSRIASTSPSPTPSPKPSLAAHCQGMHNTPGGSDPWGGCWPGPGNTGVPAGVALTPYQGPCEIRANNVVIDAKTINCGLTFLGSRGTIRDSKINGTVHNRGPGRVLIEHTVINGGSDHSETVGGGDITVLRSNLYGDQHEVHCADNCIVRNSWLHDNYNGASMGWHENGFLTNGGASFVLWHNTVGCVGSCTSDIAFIPDGNVSKATVAKNLLLATTDVSYCLYPSSDHPAKPGVLSRMMITNNVFQRGSNGKCGQYGPVYGWNSPNNRPGSDGYGNIWSGNSWSSGKKLSP